MTEFLASEFSDCDPSSSTSREVLLGAVKTTPITGKPDLKKILDDEYEYAGALNGDASNDFDRLLEEKAAAPEFEPVKPGYYRAVLVGTRSKEVSAEKAKCEATFRLVDGDEAGRQLRHPITLTANSARFAKRDLAKIGIRKVADFDKPADQTILYRLKVVIHTDDDGNRWNRIKQIEVIGSVVPPPNPFAPENLGEGSGGAL